ncbi:MAG TPA: glycosyltransferase family 39 protein [Candidatus Dormibacteraeota bacterium]
MGSRGRADDRALSTAAGLTPAALIAAAIVASRLASIAGLSSFGARGLDWVVHLATTAYDASWYRIIINRGYWSAGVADQASGFYPGYPIAVRVAELALPWPLASLEAAMLLVSAVSVVFAAWWLHELYAPRFGPRGAVIGVGLLVCSPPAFFLGLGFSEALFLALVAGTFLAAERGRWTLAGLAGGGACLVRSNGLELALPLLMAAVSARAWHSPRSLLPGVLVFAAAAAAYPLYLLAAFGDPLRYFHLQATYWHHRFTSPVVSIGTGLHRMAAAAHAWVAGHSTSVRYVDAPAVIDDGAAVVIGGVVSAAGWLGLRPHEVVWVLLVWITPLLAFPVPDSEGRYLLAAFPIFFWVGRLLARLPAASVALMAAGLIYQAVLCFRLAEGYFVG